MNGKQGRAIENMYVRARLPELIGEGSWTAIKNAFREEEFDRWVDGLETLIAAEMGTGAVINFAQASITASRHFGAEATLAIVPASLAIKHSSGNRAATLFLASVSHAAELLTDVASFLQWVAVIKQLADLAPESVEALLSRTDFVLSKLEAGALRNWVIAGIRSAAGDPTFRKSYFSLANDSALRALEQASSDILFVDVERRMKAFLMALWGLRPAIRTATIRPGQPAPRRASFDGLIIRIPEAFAGFHGQEAVAHYRALLAHIGAHAVFGGPKFPVGTLKPIQVALVSLIEDARVETLAAQDYPGLGRLWRRYHMAKPESALTADVLMPRLSRALIDPDYRDDDPWVNKGRMMFFDHRSEWYDPAISRQIGGLLGNDIGQMRIQFNAKTHIVQPSYRDDNSGLWDYGEPPPEEAETAEAIVDSVRIEQREERDRREKNKSDDEGRPANRAAKLRAVEEEVGIPVARYPEWDHVSAEERAEWTTLVEFNAKPASAEAARALTENHPGVAARIKRLVRNAKVSRPLRLRRQAQGDRLDLDACISTAIDNRLGIRPDPRVYETRIMRSRDLSVSVLLDISESTRDRIRNTTTTVLSVERAAVALLSEALAGLGDPFAVHGFCSDGREEVRYYSVKEFGQAWDAAALARLAGLRGGLSTRLGAALRHSGAEVAGERSHRRLILVVTDGEPSDVDVADPRYLVEDARKAVQDLAHQGIDVFCVGLDSGGENYLPRIFGRRGFIMIDRVEALPEKLPMLYFRMTA